MMDEEDLRELKRYQKAKKKAEVKNNLVEVAELCNCIGELYSKYEKYEEAIEEHEQERHLCQANGDRIGEAVACRKLGECHCALGSYAEALTLQRRHLTLARECNNHIEEQRAWATIGRTHLHQAESVDPQESAVANKKAERAFAQSLEVCEKVKASLKVPEYMAMKCRLYMNLGVVFDERGEIAQCADVMKRAVLIAEKFKLDNELYMCHETLTNMHQKAEDYTLALRSLGVALKLSRKLRNRVGERELLVQKALIHVGVGDFLAAKHSLKQAHRMRIDTVVNGVKLKKVFKSVTQIHDTSQDIETESDEEKLSKLHELVADGFVDLGLYKKAIVHYERVLDLSTRLTNEKRAAIYVSLAQTYADMKQYDLAINFYQQELEEWGDNQEQICRTYLNIADLEEKKGSKYNITGKLYMSAFEAARKAKHRKLQVQSLKALIALQKLNKQTTHQQETEKKLAMVQKKIAQEGKTRIDDEESSLGEEEDDEKESEDLSLSDLTVSEDSDGNDSNCVEVNTRKKSNIAKKNEKGETPLHRACIAGNLKKVKTLITQGHPINPRDYCGWLPLHEACNHGFRGIVELLLERGAWINDRGDVNCEGLTPLMDAARCGNLDVVTLLVDRGANVLAKDDHGNTALDTLREWFNAISDDINASDTLEYQRTQSLLLRKMGRSKDDKFKLQCSPVPKYINKSQSTPKIKASSGKSQAMFENRKSQNTSRWDVLTDSSDEDVYVSPSKSSQKKKPGHRSHAGISKKSHVNAMLEDQLSDGDMFFPPSLLGEDLVHNPTEVYRTAMSAIGSSAPRRQETELSKTDKQSKETQSAVSKTKRSAFLEEDEVGDDWLIEDSKAPKLKRKSSGVSGILTTSSSREHLSSQTKKRRMTDKSERFSDFLKKRQKVQKEKREFEQDKRLFLTDSDGDSSVDSTRNRFDVTSTSRNIIHEEEEDNSTRESSEIYEIQEDKEKWDSDDDILCQMDPTFEDFMSTSEIAEYEQNNQERPNNSISTDFHHSQFSLAKENVSSSRFTDDNFSQRNVSANVNVASGSKPYQASSENRNVKDNVPKSIPKTNRNECEQIGMSQSLPVQHTSVKRSDPVVKPLLRLKVQIEDKTLLIPLTASDCNKNMSWLAEEVGERYFSMYLQRPVVSFSTSDGTMLCPVDAISAVVEDNDHLKAAITMWDHPGVKELYSKVCGMFNVEVNQNIATRLSDCEMKGLLNLNELGLGQQQLKPVYRSLEGHNLSEICLAGNRLGDAGIASLTQLLKSSPRLQTLNLDANGLSSESLKSISKILKDGSLQNLQDLSLSHNCLGDIAGEWLANILTDIISLESLSLAACNFSAKLFTQNICCALKKHPLEKVNFAENRIGVDGIASLLDSLHADKLSILNISQTISTTSNLAQHLQTFTTSKDIVSLKELNISGCQLSASEIVFVTRLAVDVPSLQKLNLSQNQGFSNTTLQKLLFLSAHKHNNFEELTARGCSITAPLSSEVIDGFTLKMSSCCPLRKFVFTCRGLSKNEMDSIINVWKSVWTDSAVVKIVGPSVSLSVV